MTIRAKYNSTCGACGKSIRKGDSIEWTRGKKAICAACTGNGAQPTEAAGNGLYVCPDCGERTLTGREKAKGYHCMNCTRMAEFGIDCM